MSHIKNTIKGASGYILKHAFFKSLRVNRMNIILMYHRVLKDSPNGYDDHGLYVNSATLEMHILQIRDMFDIVPLTTLIEFEEQERGLCAITFDDGWIDTYDVAFPILRKHKVPATVFVPTGLIGKKDCFWFENLRNLANKTVEKNAQLLFLKYFTRVISKWRPSNLSMTSLSDLISCMKYVPSNILMGIISAAYEEIGIDWGNNKQIIDWGQILEMSQYDISFGPHGSQHFILPTIDSDLKRDEIFSPFDVFQEKGIRPVPIFSYPNGNWDNESVNLVIEAGYKGAVTTHLGYNDHQTNSFLLNRIGLHEYISNTPSMFWFRLFQAVMGGKGSTSQNILKGMLSV